jgi:hypothetical protein
MGAFWARLLACERRAERYLRIINDLERQIRALQQQLASQRSN